MTPSDVLGKLRPMAHRSKVPPAEPAPQPAEEGGDLHGEGEVHRHVERAVGRREGLLQAADGLDEEDAYAAGEVGFVVSKLRKEGHHHRRPGRPLQGRTASPVRDVVPTLVAGRHRRAYCPTS